MLFKKRQLDDSESARGQERIRRAALTTASSLFSKAGTLVVLIVTVPMALQYLGSERFGMWMTLSSLLALMSFADFGIGNGVLDMVSKAQRDDNDVEITEVISSGAIGLLLISILMVLVTIVLYPVVSWQQIFQAKSELAIRESGPSWLVFLLCLAITIPLTLASKVQLGLQQGYATNLWAGVGGVMSLVGVIAAIYLEMGVPGLVLALYGGPVLAQAINYIVYFNFLEKKLAPRLSCVSMETMRKIYSSGFIFFLLQVTAVVSFRADTLFVVHYSGAAEAGTYAVVERMFSTVTMLVGVATAPLWPAYSEAIRRNDYTWTRTVLKNSLFISMAATATIAIAITVMAPYILTMWLQRPFTAPLMLVLGFALWKTVEAGTSAAVMFMNGAGAIKLQLAMVATMCVVSVALKMTLVPIFGIWSIVWLTLVSYSICLCIPLFFVIPRLLRDISRPSS
jgi:O-antigen/teichoic acid export membrane protein